MILTKIETNRLNGPIKPWLIRIYDIENDSDYIFNIKCEGFDPGTFKYLMGKGFSEEDLYDGEWNLDQFKDHWRDNYMDRVVVGWDGCFNATAMKLSGIRVKRVLSLMDLLIFIRPNLVSYSLPVVAKSLNLQGNDWENLMEIFKYLHNEVLQDKKKR